MKRRLLLFLTSLGVLLLIAACSNSQPTALPTSPPATSPTESPATAQNISPAQASEYPPPAQPPTPVPAYPGSETQNSPANVPTPTLDHAMGIVKGRLLLNGQPAPNEILYLAEVVKDQSGREMVVSYDRASSPNTVTDDQGNFVFYNIKPNKYGLILDTVVDSYLLHYPGEEIKQILFSVEADKTTDLGNLDYDSLPGRNP